MRRIIVGSSSPHKIRAVEIAYRELGLPADITSLVVPSGVNPQPRGLEETRQGAETRAEIAGTSEVGVYGIGIENGIVQLRDDLNLDLAVIVIRTPYGQFFYSLTPAVVFPPDAVRLAEERGFDRITVGEVLAELTGASGAASDPHVMLTHHRLTREHILASGVLVAIAQIPGL